MSQRIRPSADKTSEAEAACRNCLRLIIKVNWVQRDLGPRFHARSLIRNLSSGQDLLSVSRAFYVFYVLRFTPDAFCFSFHVVLVIVLAAA